MKNTVRNILSITTCLALIVVLGVAINCSHPEEASAKKVPIGQIFQELEDLAVKMRKNHFKYRRGPYGSDVPSYKKSLSHRRTYSCITYITWGLQAVGLYSQSGSLHGFWMNAKKCGINGSTKGFLGKKKILNGHGKKLKTLVKNGTVKPGDVIGRCAGGPHTQMYAGKKNGDYLCYSVGHKIPPKGLRSCAARKGNGGNERVGGIIRLLSIDRNDTRKRNSDGASLDEEEEDKEEDAVIAAKVKEEKRKKNSEGNKSECRKK